MSEFAPRPDGTVSLTELRKAKTQELRERSEADPEIMTSVRKRAGFFADIYLRSRRDRIDRPYRENISYGVQKLILIFTEGNEKVGIGTNMQRLLDAYLTSYGDMQKAATAFDDFASCAYHNRDAFKLEENMPARGLTEPEMFEELYDFVIKKVPEVAVPVPPAEDA